MRAALLLLALAAAGAARADETAPLGTAPTLVRRALSAVPNAGAIRARIWVPDLDEGFVPQGLAVAGGRIALSGYVSTEKGQDRGPCRLAWIEPATGRVARRLAIPAPCGHAGGAAALPDGRIVVIDTHALFVVAADGGARAIALTPPLTGSFGAADAASLWLGRYDKGGGKLWRLPLDALTRETLGETDATRVLDAPARAQGLAIDASGGLWVASSGPRSGEIARLDASGAIIARYPAPAGIEDLAFDAAGRLWASSEAGARRWSDWPTFFPLVFSIDPAALRTVP